MSKYKVLLLSYRVQEKVKQDLPRLKAAKRGLPLFIIIISGHDNEYVLKAGMWRYFTYIIGIPYIMLYVFK